MRALHINDYAENKGGAEAVMATTLQALAAHGVDVDSFTVQDVVAHRRTPWSYISNGAAVRALQDRLDTFKPDLIHLHNFYHELSPAILKPIGRFKASGGSVVMTAHDYHLRCPDPTLRWFDRHGAHLLDPEAPIHGWRYWSGRWDQRGFGHHCLRTCQHFWNYRVHRRIGVIDCVLCPSQFCLSVMSKLGVPTKYLPNPAPATELPTSVSRYEKPTLLFAGRLEPEKGIEQIVSIWPTDGQVHLEIIGQGSQEKAIEQLIRQRGLEHLVTLHGHIDRLSVMDRMGSVHGVLVPSRCYENAPNVLVEAVSRGTPVLVANLGGMAEFVRDTGAGWTFELDDPSSLRSGLDQIEQFCKSGKGPIEDPHAIIEARCCEAYIEQLIRIYDQLIDDNHGMMVRS